jgi:hypothetical protein
MDGTAVAVRHTVETNCPFDDGRSTTMLKPLEKPKRSLVHHPSDALDNFCHYDAANRTWREFDTSLSHQLLELEFQNRRYIRARPGFDRRSS